MGVVAVAAGLFAVVFTAKLLPDIDFFHQNALLTGLILAAVFLPVTYKVFVKLRKWDRNRSGPQYIRQSETFIIDDSGVAFGDHRFSHAEILTVEARHPPEYGGRPDMMIYDNDLQGRARASGFRSGLAFISRCYALYVKSENRPHAVMVAFGLTMPNAAQLADFIMAEISKRK